MTNKDKFLKDGVSVEEFIQKLTNHINKTQKSTYEKIKEFLEQPAQILTEDEEVILRLFQKKYEKFGRNGYGNILFRNEIGEPYYLEKSVDILFKDLFQFIENGEEYEIAELLKGE